MIYKDAALKNMNIIDRICLAVFGKTEYYENHFAGYLILMPGSYKI